jgi:hypothetical protein
MKRRRLTVTYTQPESRRDQFPRPRLEPMPLLRLHGRWLDRAGFAIGARVRVIVASGLLALEVIDPENDQD